MDADNDQQSIRLTTTAPGGTPTHSPPQQTAVGLWPVVIRVIPVYVVFFIPMLPLTQIVGVPVLLLVLFIAVLTMWIQRKSVLGPLFPFELVRLARRGRMILLRCLYPLALLICLWFVYREWMRYTGSANATYTSEIVPNQMAQIAENFSLTILIVQNAAVLVLTPIYAGVAIVKERQQRSLEFLFTSHLSDREIIFGKAAARLIALATVLLAGLPFLALIQFWGGVDPLLIVPGFIATAFTLLLAGSASILSSVICRTYAGAILTAYALVLFPLICCTVPPFYWGNPVYFLIMLHSAMPEGVLLTPLSAVKTTYPPFWVAYMMTNSYIVYHSLLSFIFLYYAVRLLRREEPQQPPPPRYIHLTPAEQELIRRRYGQTTPAALTLTPYPQPVWDRSLWWKELHGTEHPVMGLFSIAAIMMTGVTCIFGVTVIISHFMTSQHTLEGIRVGWNHFIRGMTALQLLAICTFVGIYACSAVTREREKRTLESLLTLPIERGQLLFVKWSAGIHRHVYVLGGLCFFWVCCVLTLSLHPLAFLALMAAAAAHLFFAASLGIWLSIVCRSTLQATLMMGMVFLAITVGAWFFLPVTWPAVQAAVNPICTWLILGFGWTPSEDLLPTYSAALIPAALAGVGCYGLAGGALWLAATREFKSDRILTQ